MTTFVRHCSTVTFTLHRCGDPLLSSDTLRDLACTEFMVMSVVDQVKPDGPPIERKCQNGESSERSARFARLPLLQLHQDPNHAMERCHFWLNLVAFNPE